MKTTMITKMMLAVAFTVASVLTISAVPPIRYSNTEVDNGLVTAKIIYELNGQYLTPEFRFEYQYGADDRIVEKRAFKWNGTQWINYYRISTVYSDTEAHMQYAIWDEKAKAFQPTEKYVYQLDKAGKFVAQYSYQLNGKNDWELTQVTLSEGVLAKY